VRAFATKPVLGWHAIAAYEGIAMKMQCVVFAAATFFVAGPTLGQSPSPDKGSIKSPAQVDGRGLRKIEESWFGKVDLVEKTSGRAVRFFARHDGLSLFATGDFKTILLEGYYAKAKMSVGYRTINCPGGISGSCGRVDFVSVDAGNNF
jgi:hypothetical protein